MYSCCPWGACPACGFIKLDIEKSKNKGIFNSLIRPAAGLIKVARHLARLGSTTPSGFAGLLDTRIRSAWLGAPRPRLTSRMPVWEPRRRAGSGCVSVSRQPKRHSAFVFDTRCYACTKVIYESRLCGHLWRGTALNDL